MDKGKYFIGVIIAAIIALIFSAFNFLQPCNSGLFIGGCELGRIYLLGWSILFFIVYCILSFILFKYWQKNEKIVTVKNFLISNIVIIFLSIYLSNPPVTQMLIFNTIDSIRFKIDQYRGEQLTSEIAKNISVDNFRESPVINNQNGKYDGIEVTFDLIVQKEDYYTGKVYVSFYYDAIEPNKPAGMKSYFESAEFGDLIKANTPKTYTFILKPNEAFYNAKQDGPYSVKINVWAKTPRKFGFGLQNFSISYMGDWSQYNRGETRTHLTKKDLFTKPYLFPDFYNPFYNPD